MVGRKRVFQYPHVYVAIGTDGGRGGAVVGNGCPAAAVWVQQRDLRLRYQRRAVEREKKAVGAVADGNVQRLSIATERRGAVLRHLVDAPISRGHCGRDITRSAIRGNAGEATLKSLGRRAVYLEAEIYVASAVGCDRSIDRYVAVQHTWIK